MSVAGIPSCKYSSLSAYTILSNHSRHLVLEERAVYYRESKNGLYSALPFVLSNTLVNIPFLFISTVIFTVICYWAIVRLFSFTLVSILTKIFCRGCTQALLHSSVMLSISSWPSSLQRVKRSSFRPYSPSSWRPWPLAHCEYPLASFSVVS